MILHTSAIVVLNFLQWCAYQNGQTPFYEANGLFLAYPLKARGGGTIMPPLSKSNVLDLWLRPDL